MPLTVLPRCLLGERSAMGMDVFRINHFQKKKKKSSRPTEESPARRVGINVTGG
jgi:hypothetical protein